MSSSVAGTNRISSKVGGLKIDRVYTVEGQDPFDGVKWTKRKAEIKGENGQTIFVMEDVEAPEFWSQRAVDIAADKYFRKAGVPGRGHEFSVRQMISRVVTAIRKAGARFGGYFATADDVQAFADELTYMLLHQIGAFNSPVWFNCGLFEEYGIEGSECGTWAWSFEEGKAVPVTKSYVRPQVSACFIQSIKDDLMDIADFVRREMRLFKFGSGSGANFSSLRGENEPLSNGGASSGLMSFLEIFDKGAGAIKSGGTTRRAAKMVILNADHPDIEKFVEWKAREEDKALALIRAGYPNDFNGEAYRTVSGQNGNNSVRVTDEFMNAVLGKQTWDLVYRTTKKVAKKVQANELFRKIAEAAWRCADPGLQFDTTINKWHTCPKSGRINGSNPCCLVGETLVDTSEGFIEIEKLERASANGEALPYSFSFNLETGLPVLRQIKRVWVAGETKRLVEVTTDRGITVRCTPEHRFLLRSGDYVEAKALKAGTRLRKVGRAVNVNRCGRKMLYHRVTETSANGTVWQNRFMWEQVNGEIPAGHHVHHKNDDPTDDRLSNFELREGVEHQVEHSTGSANPRFIEASDEALVEVWEAVESEPRDGRSKGPAVTVWRWNSYVRRNGLEGSIPLARGDGRIRGMEWSEFESWIESRRDLVNDRVVSVSTISLDAPVKVYDLEVDGVHNFGVSSKDSKGVHSIVVHNSEYMHLDDTACNLASVNLMKFTSRSEGKLQFDANRLRHACRVFTLAQEILVDHASYPTREIAENAHAFRQLGLGYANLGTLLMVMGVPYDSMVGCSTAGAITAIVTGTGYATSAEIAASKGPFPGFAHNREDMLGVMRMHQAAADDLVGHYCAFDLKGAAVESWQSALALGQVHGYRNAQATVIAPTGTIGFMMDCDTTGVEPEFTLVKYKKMAGGGYMKIVNRSVAPALMSLGYSDDAVQAILKHIEQNETIEGAPGFKEEHLPVFDCANKCGKNGQRFIRPRGHVEMLAAVQPFVSGSISKTVNCPKETTVEEIEQLYLEAWKRGLKCIAIYRDGSKHAQPLSTSDSKTEKAGTPKAESKAETAKTETSKAEAIAQTIALLANKKADQHKPSVRTAEAPPAPVRHRLPYRRKNGITQELVVGGTKVYLRTGEYGDGSPGEIFVDLAKEGGALGALLNCFAIAVSLGLQHGVPMQEYVEAFTFQKFDPAGPVVGHPNVKMATSVIDAIFRVLAVEYMGEEGLQQYAQVKTPPAPRGDVQLIEALRRIAGNGSAGDSFQKFVDALKLTREISGLPPETPGEPALKDIVGVVAPAKNGHANGGGHANGSGAPKTSGQLCGRCGGVMQRVGTCLGCQSCGSTTGCS